MTPYELTYIIPARVKEPAQVKSSIVGIIKEKGGDIWAEIDFGKRRLSYAVDHARNGEFVGVEFQADGSKVAEIKSALNVFDDIVRFQFSQLKKLSDKENLKTDILRSEITGRLEIMRPEAVKTATPVQMESVKEMVAKPIEPIAAAEQPVESKIAEAAEPKAEALPVEAAPIQTVQAEPEKPTHKKEKEAKVSLEELDKKLEEILDEEVK